MERAKKLEGENRYGITCLACGCGHSLDGWEFNGDLENPTFKPSLLVTGYLDNEQPNGVCHSYITDGNIQYLSDSTHRYAGKTVRLNAFADYDSPIVEVN